MNSYFYIVIFSIFHLSSFALDPLKRPKLEKVPSVKQPKKGLTAASLTKIAAFKISCFEEKGIISSDDIKKIPFDCQGKIAYFKKYNNDLNALLLEAIDNKKLTQNIPELFAMGANPYYTDFQGESFLHIAIAHDKQLAFEELLLHPKIDIDSCNYQGYTPLRQAIFFKDRDKKIFYIEKLLEYNAIIDQRNMIHPTTPLMYLCTTEFNAAIAQRFLQTINLNKKNFDWITATPLTYAIVAQKKEWVEWLIQNGANINIKTTEGTPLSLARQGGDDEIIKLVTDAGAQE